MIAHASSAPQARCSSSSTRSARAIALDERHVRGAAAQRLEPERAGAGKAVEHARARRRVGPSTLNSVSRSPSDVGRTAAPGGADSRRPLQRPAMMRIRIPIRKLPDQPTPTRPKRVGPVRREVLDERLRRAAVVEPRDGFAPRVFHQRVIAQQIADAQRRQAGLPRAEEIAGPAQRQIALGDHEAVGRLDERVEPRPRPPR